MADILYPSFKTKKAFKEALKNGEAVFVQPTSPFFNGYENGQVVSVVGPTAYNRKWYASVKVNEKGQVLKLVR